MRFTNIDFKLQISYTFFLNKLLYRKLYKAFLEQYYEKPII